MQVSFCAEKSVQLVRVAFFPSDFIQNPYFRTYFPNFSIVWLFPGLLDSLGGSEDIDAKWTSQSTEELLGGGPPETGSSSFETRKLSPPLLAVLGDSSRCRSGSDPSISKPGFSNSDKNSIGSFADRKARNNSTDTSFSSPKSSKFNNLFVTSKTTNSLIHEFKVLQNVFWNKKERLQMFFKEINKK